MANIQLDLIGGCEFRDALGSPLKLSARKARALLAFLTVQDNTPQTRERLAALLWEEADAELARTSLRQALSAIRRALPDTVRSALQADALQVAFDARQADVDVVRLRQLLAEATPASLAAALGLYRGELLEGIDARSGTFDEWLAEERRSLRREVVAGAQKLRQLCREVGDAEGEITALVRLIALEPLNEAAHRELMEVYARCGGYTDALRQYQLCRSALRRELDVAPEPATEALYRELMRRRRAAGDESPVAPVTGEASQVHSAEVSSPATDRIVVADRSLRDAVVLVIQIHGLADRQRECDPEDARELTATIQQRVDDLVREFGGVTDRLAGERMLAVFGLGGLKGNEPERALRAGIDICAAFAEQPDGTSLAVSGGVAQGQLLPHRANEPFPLSGRPVTDAQTLAAQAGREEILLSDDLRRALGERVSVLAFESDRAPGAWKLEALRVTSPGGLRAPLAGRRAELALLLALLDRTLASNRGRTILIRGEAGIGKTRLLEALDEAGRDRNVACHRVEVLDFGRIEARRPLAALVASLLGITSEASPEDRRRAVTEAIAAGRLPGDSVIHASELVSASLPPELVSVERNVDSQIREHGRLDVVRRLLETACRERPVLLVIEDVHWASSEEAARLGELAGVIATNRALLVMSTRPEEDPINAAWRARARGCPVTTLDLAPLADDEALELAGAYPDLPAAVIQECIRRAEGHPLFLDQLLRAASAGETSMPGSVRALVLARVDHLSEADRQALMAAAVLGLRFPRDALRHVLGDPACDLSGLVDAGLLVAEDTDVSFVHALFRDAVYESLLKATRRDLHLRAASWYVDRDPGVRAGHLAQAGDPSAATAHVEAAEAEAAGYRLERALELVQRARRLARDPADLSVAGCLLGEILTQTGHTHDAISVFREVTDLAMNTGLAARAWLGLAGALRIVDRYEEALAALDRCENALAGLERADLRVRIWTLRGNIFFPQGEHDACLHAHEQARLWAEKAESPLDEARALGGLGDAWYQRGHMLTAQAHFARCVEHARQHGSLGLVLSYAPMLAISRAFCGQLGPALADSRDLVREAARVGDLRSELLARDGEACVCLYGADYAGAQQTGERALALARQLGTRRFEAEVMSIMGLALGELGHAEEARELLDQATAIALEVCPTYCGPWCLSAKALFTQERGRARALLKQGEALLAQGCVSHNYLEFYRHAMEFSIRRSDWSEARRYARALREYTSGEPLPWAEVLIRRAELLADRAEGRSQPDFEARLSQLVEEIESMGFAWLLPALRQAECSEH